MAMTHGEKKLYPVEIKFDLSELPSETLITGMAYEDGGVDRRLEKNNDRVILTFRDEPVENVIVALSGKTVTRIQLDELPKLR